MCQLGRCCPYVVVGRQAVLSSFPTVSSFVKESGQPPRRQAGPCAFMGTSYGGGQETSRDPCFYADMIYLARTELHYGEACTLNRGQLWETCISFVQLSETLEIEPNICQSPFASERAFDSKILCVYQRVGTTFRPTIVILLEMLLSRGGLCSECSYHC